MLIRLPRNWLLVTCGLLAAGCATTSPAPAPNIPRADPSAAKLAAIIQPVAHAETAPAGPVQVDDFVQLAIARNPRMARATAAIEAAQGRLIQAGLYPNPSVAATFDELGDRTGTLGVNTVPQLTQEIVTGKKLSLSQAVAAREVDRATLEFLRERYALIGAVRAAYYDLYALEQRIEKLNELKHLANDSVRTGEALRESKLLANLDVVQLQVEFARYESLALSAEEERSAAQRRLAAVVGDPRLAVGKPAGPFEDVPLYDADRTREAVLTAHPDVRVARVGVERAQAAIRRAEAEPIPNLTLTSGYVRQNQNKSNDWMFGLSAPIPVWNKNQGNVHAAKAELGMAIQDVARVENDLAERVAVALRAYAAATTLASRYQQNLLPKAEEVYKLSNDAFKAGQFENYLRVLQAQRAVAEARLERVRALGDAWKAAAELSGLLLEDWWPGPPPAHAVKPR